MLRTTLAAVLGLILAAPAAAQTNYFNSGRQQIGVAANPAATVQSLNGLATFPTLSTVRNITPTNAVLYGSIVRAGYAVAGDAASLTLVWQSTCPGTPDNRGYLIAPNASSSGCWQGVGPAVGDMLEYGVSATASDNSAALQAWLNEGCNFALTAPAGVYTFSTGPLSTKTGCDHLRIDGHNTTLRYNGTSTTTDLLVIGPVYPAAFQLGDEISGITVDSNTVMTGGTAVHVQHIGSAWLTQVNPQGQTDSGETGSLYNGLWCDNCFNTWATDFWSVATNDTVRASGRPDGTASMAGFYLGRCYGTLGAVGLHIGGGAGAVDSLGCAWVGNGINLLVDNAIISRGNGACVFDSVTAFDSATGNTANIELNDSLFVANQVMVFAGAWLATGPAAGLYVKSLNGQKVIANFSVITNFTGDGIKVDDGSATISDNNGPGIYTNGGYGVDATTASTTIFLDGAPINNTSGKYNTNSGLPNWPN